MCLLHDSIFSIEHTEHPGIMWMNPIHKQKFSSPNELEPLFSVRVKKIGMYNPMNMQKGMLLYIKYVLDKYAALY